MSMTATVIDQTIPDHTELIRAIGPVIGEAGAKAEATDSFVSENFNTLRDNGLLEAGVPAELGGGGASMRELAAVLRGLAPYCASTALALAMHYHQVAIATWRWRNQKAPVEPVLRRIAKDRIVLVSTGGADWLDSSGRAEKVEGGWRIFGRKSFASASPAGTLLMTSAVAETAEGREVLHFALPLNAPGVQVIDNWRALGMRATGSHDVILDGAFVADGAIGGRRPAGVWSPLYHLVSMIALPLIYMVYSGIADGARSTALTHARAKSQSLDDERIALAGALENAWLTNDLLAERLVMIAESTQPGPATTQKALHGRVQLAGAAIETVERAMVLVGGAAFQRHLPFERMWRDVQGARFHPLTDQRQLRFAGRQALGLPLDA